MTSSITFALECPVCLDTIHSPVVPPCGHLICEPCIKLHISLSSTNPFEAKCPMCRASFPSVLPNLSLIPNKYHVFINPPLRRVYLGDRVDNKALINDLKSKIICLEGCIETLKSGKESAERESRRMLDRAKEDARLALDEAKKEAQLALDLVNVDAQLTLNEVKKEARLARDKVKRDAQLALDKAKVDLRLANFSLEECRAENVALKSKIIKSRSVRKASGQSSRSIKSFSKRVQLAPADKPYAYFSLANDILLVSAAREALVALSPSPTSQSGASTVNSGSNMPSPTTNQVIAATTSVAGESCATLNPILHRSPTPPLLYPSPSTSPAVRPHDLLEHISLVPTPGHSEQLGSMTSGIDFGVSAH